MNTLYSAHKKTLTGSEPIQGAVFLHQHEALRVGDTFKELAAFESKEEYEAHLFKIKKIEARKALIHAGYSAEEAKTLIP